MLRKIKLQSTLALAVLAAAPFFARADVLLDDTWASGTRTVQSLPTRSAWFSSDGSALVATTGSMTLTNGTSAVLAITYFGANSSTPVQLSAGDTLTATIKLTLTGVGANNGSQGFRLGLFDFADSSLSPAWVAADGFGNSSQGSGVRGYTLFQNMGLVFNSASPMDLRVRTNVASSTLLGTSSDWKSLVTGPGNTNNFQGFAGGVQYVLRFSAQRTSTNSLIVSATWSNVVSGRTLSVSVNDTNAASFNFDGIALRPQTAALSATNITFQEVKVEISSPATAPNITTQPQNQSVSVGQNASFSVVADGAAPLSYQWYYNTNTVLTNATAPTLTLTNVQFSSAGGYSVIVSNSLGTQTSAVAILTVSAAATPPGITNQPQSQTVLAGQTASFTVGTTGTSPLSYQWYFNATNSLANGTNATLTLTNVQLSDAGSYSVMVTNAAGSTNSAAAVLTVNAPPTITAQPQNQAVSAGQSASFSVVANGSPTLGYQWYFNGTSPIASGTNSTLTLSNVQTNNAGGYQVVVTNGFGSATSAVATLSIGTAGVGAPNFDLVGFAKLDGFTTFGYNQQVIGGVTGGSAGTNVQVWTALDFAKYAQTNYPLLIEVMTNLDLGIASLAIGISQPTYSNFLAAEVLVRSNKTIYSKIGATLSHGTLRIGKTSLGPQGNIIIRNLKFRDLYEYDPSGNYDSKGWDYVHLEEGSHHVWVDHCDFQQVYDGMLDLAHGSDYLTASWNVFRTQKKCSLIGHSDNNQSEDTNHLNVTFHHNYYVNVDERMPRMRFGNAHVFNLYCESLGGNGIQSTCGAATLVENSYFYHPLSGTLPTRYENGGPTGTVKVANSTIVNSPGVNVAFRQFGQAAFQFNYPFNSNQPPYAYAMDNTTNVPFLVTNYAGVGKVNPSFISQPQGQAVTVGQTATFNVTVAGASPLAYRWYFNSTPLANGTNASLSVANAQSTNAGSYSVVASNMFGVTTSIVAALTVSAGAVAPSIINQPQNQTIVAGQTAAFSVGASGTAPLRYQWFFNTNTVLASATNATLSITNVQLTNAGAYSVVVTNVVGSATSGYAMLVLNHPPAPGPFAIATGQDTPVSIPENSLLAAGSDPDGDGLNISGVNPLSAHNGSVTFDGSQITYLPGIGYNGPDSMSYTLADDRGASSIGSVAINVVSGGVIVSATHSLAISVASGSFHASFAGVPNLTYSLDRATNLLGPWELDYTNITAGTNGIMEVVDPDTSVPQRLYRVIYP